MRELLIMSLFLTISSAKDIKPSAKIPHDECMKYPYKQTIGGTMHSRMVQKKRLYRLAKDEANYTEDEALKEIQKRYKNLDIDKVTLTVKNCFIYFKAKNSKYIYYFDAKNLNLIQKKEI